VTAAIIPAYDLHGELRLRFAAVCRRLSEARQRQSQKDSTSNRAAVARCMAHVDAILDMHLECERLRYSAMHRPGRGPSSAESPR
jgi:hypothetical protein